MQLSPTMRVMAFLLVLGLAKPSELPRPADTIEYLRLLASLKAGNVSLTPQNASTSAPWTYNLQARKFQQKLQEGEIIFISAIQMPIIKGLGCLLLPFFLSRGYAQLLIIKIKCMKMYKHKAYLIFVLCIMYIITS